MVPNENITPSISLNDAGCLVVRTLDDNGQRVTHVMDIAAMVKLEVQVAVAEYIKTLHPQAL